MRSKLMAYAHRISNKLAAGPRAAATVKTIAYEIPEITPIVCRRSDAEEVRVNLLIPALSLKHVFGGIRTALDFFTDFIQPYDNARIIITDETVSDLLGFGTASDWVLLEPEAADTEARSIICFGNRYNKTIPIRKGDIFIATAWWTAYHAERIASWQQSTWHAKPASIVYLVQDFEPGFYKWSSRYMLALSTYLQENMIAVVNTQLLHDYFKENHIELAKHYVFNPVINRALRDILLENKPVAKKKRIVFYGRPSVERNAFEIIIAALAEWAKRHSNAGDWEIISMGEEYQAPVFATGITINVRGKLSIAEYGNMLKSAGIGISLMVSPHPSYPPLEMAAFGLAVITNSFANKDLSTFHDNINSIGALTPASLATALGNCCHAFETGNGPAQNKPFKKLPFLDNGTGFDFIPQLRQDLHLMIK